MNRSTEVGSGVGKVVGVVLKQLLRKSAHGVISDDAKYDVPTWLGRSSTQVVIEHLLHDPDRMVRWSAAFVLRKRRDPVSIDPLWQVMHDETSSLVRQQTAVALGKIGTMASLGPLIEGLAHDHDGTVRQACAIALGNLRFTQAAADIVNVLVHEQVAFVRWDCVLSLAQVGDSRLVHLLSEMASKESVEFVRRAYLEVLEHMAERR